MYRQLIGSTAWLLAEAVALAFDAAVGPNEQRLRLDRWRTRRPGELHVKRFAARVRPAPPAPVRSIAGVTVLADRSARDRPCAAACARASAAELSTGGRLNERQVRLGDGVALDVVWSQVSGPPGVSSRTMPRRAPPSPS